MQKERSSGFLNFLHSFRGLAIISIVAGHAVSAMFIAAYHRYNWSDPILIVNEILFNQCTLYFALLSGLLYSAVLKEKSYKKFYMNKFLYVFLPYLFFTILYGLVKFQRYNFIYVDRIDMAFKHLFTNLVFGGANFVLWYIPVLFGLYLLTPFFNFLFNYKKYTIVVIWIIVLLPLISSGIKIPTIYGTIISRVIYFSGAYVLGMYLGINIEASMNWFKKQLFPIIFLVCISMLLLGYLHFFNINRLGGIRLQDSVYYIQKICLAVAIIVLLRELRDKQSVWLKTIATYSTPIYFIHGAIVFSWAPLFLFRIGGTYNAFSILAGALVLLVFTIALSMFVAFVIKKMFGKKSRMIISS